MAEYYVGIDIGGMTIKGIVLDKDGKALCEDVAVTGSENGGDFMCDIIAELVFSMLKKCGVDKEDAHVGVGCPGIIDSENGVLVFSGNLNLRDYPLASKLKERIGISVRITNDANAAALGEAKFGAGKNYKNSILVTLGTGVGGGIIIDGELFEGYRSAGAEIGHMVIERHGDVCSLPQARLFRGLLAQGYRPRKGARAGRWRITPALQCGLNTPPTPPTARRRSISTTPISTPKRWWTGTPNTSRAALQTSQTSSAPKS